MKILNLFLYTFILLFAFFSFSFSEAAVIGGVEYNNVVGWAQSENVGAISFSCHTAEAEANGDIGGFVQDCENQWGVNIITPQESLSLGLDSGAIIGRAWSSSVGWISFNRSETGDPPAFDSRFQNSENIAEYDSSSGRIIGWARVLSACASVPCSSIDDTYWDGWIQFPDSSNAVTIRSDGTWYGYTWGGNVIGWINFSNPRRAFLGDIVSDFANSAPVASINSFSSVVENGNSFSMVLNLDASTSYDPDSSGGDGLTYVWDLGDGTTMTGPIVSHTYNTEGVYTISLTVIDNLGESSTVTETVSFVSPNLNVCALSCTSDSDCNLAAGNFCFIQNGETSGICMASSGAGQTGQGEQNTQTQTSPFECVLSDSDNILKECKQLIEVCPPSGVYSNGDSCNYSANPQEYILAGQSDFECGEDSILGAFCIGPELEFYNDEQRVVLGDCPSSGVCSDGVLCTPGEENVCAGESFVYACSGESSSDVRGVIGGYKSLPVSEPTMPIGVQPGGEACTKPTNNAPNNCEGINGCIYYGFGVDGTRIGNNSVANCIGDSVEGDLELSGCFYQDGRGGKNVCELDYPTGCVYYANGLTNCLPSSSFDGLPSDPSGDDPSLDCRVIKSGANTVVDCTKIESGVGKGCVFFSDGSIDCTYAESVGEAYSGCIYKPNPKNGIECPGIKKSSIDTVKYVGCILTDDAPGQYLDPVSPCLSDGTCAGDGEVCVGGSCLPACGGSSNACSVGQNCTSFCPDGQVYDNGVCVDLAWAQIPECKNTYLKNSAIGDPFSIFRKLPTNTQEIYFGMSTNENLNCRYSINPTAVFDFMNDFNVSTGALEHETLLSGLSPLPDINRYLIRCQNTETLEEAPACKVSIKVGQACSSNADCSSGQFCNASGFCETPQCSGAIPERLSSFPNGIETVGIGMSTEFPAPETPSVCKYSKDSRLSFQDMSSIFYSPDNLNHSAVVSDIVEGYNAYFVRCQSNDQQIISGQCKIDFSVGGSSQACSLNTDCENNQFCNPITDTCEVLICPEGMVFNSDTNTCDGAVCSSDVDCETGSFCNSVTDRCSSCLPGYNFNVLSGLCEPILGCPNGTVFNNITGMCESDIDIEASEEVNTCNVLGIEFNGVAPGTGIGPLQNCSIVAVLMALLQWFAWFVSLFAVVYGLRGGYLYITSAGDQRKLDESKKAIIYTMVGVVVAIVSFSIIAITRAIVGI